MSDGTFSAVILGGVLAMVITIGWLWWRGQRSQQQDDRVRLEGLGGEFDLEPWDRDVADVAPDRFPSEPEAELVRRSESAIQVDMGVAGQAEPTKRKATRAPKAGAPKKRKTVVKRTKRK